MKFHFLFKRFLCAISFSNPIKIDYSFQHLFLKFNFSFGIFKFEGKNNNNNIINSKNELLNS